MTVTVVGTDDMEMSSRMNIVNSTIAVEQPSEEIKVADKKTS